MTLKRSEPNKNTWQKQMTDGPTKTSARISSLFLCVLSKASVCSVSLFLAHFSMSLSKTNDNDERQRDGETTESGKAAFLIYLKLPHQNTRQAATQMEKDQTVQLFCKVSLCQRHVLVQPGSDAILTQPSLLFPLYLSPLILFPFSRMMRFQLSHILS